MTEQEHAPLREHTTFRIGGPAALFITAETIDEIPAAFQHALERGLSVYPLGEGSNVLATDAEVRKAILHLKSANVTYETEGDDVRVTADGGVSWDALVSETTARGLWGLENLAGIPGTVGAAPVQNIGAYGREVMDVIMHVDAYDPSQKAFVRYEHADCGFSYRDSRFKREPGPFITRVSFSLSRTPRPMLSYPDLQARVNEGIGLSTPLRIAEEVRAIRARKFPDLSVLGTAGSFFKNPVITPEAYVRLREHYPELPGFETEKGVKVPLAWILDHALSLRGYACGPVRLFEKQPLVLVAEAGATARDVDALADDVAQRVHAATGIVIEREVQTLQ
ncbi:MAG TPA: UDP-N-acetylmuramate dehydrogenase [Candidatus Paceibacterota bacterium]|nr:UDP-N-acetylmuramate dehydrogenase [Candidatus Paceibacterota bacterium]